MSERALIPARWVGPGDVVTASGAQLRYGDEYLVPPGEALASDNWKPVDEKAAKAAAKRADAESEPEPEGNPAPEATIAAPAAAGGSA
jgi:hypothetical protein